MVPNSAFAPILTPFDESGAHIDGVAFTRHLSYLADAGLNGVLILGTNGEYAHLDLAEKNELLALALKNEQLQVIVGATVQESTEGTLALCSALNNYGPRLAGILVAPPYFKEYRAGQQVAAATVAEFFRELSRRVPDVPLYLYNVPQGADQQQTAAVSPAVIKSLGDASIAGVKDSSGNVENISAYLSVRPNLEILIGNDHALSEGVKAGARGSITACANVFPSTVKILYSSMFTSLQSQAQSELSALRGLLDMIPGKLVAVQKLLLHLLGVVDHLAPVRIPGGSLSDIEKKKLLVRIRQICSTLELNQGVGRELAQKVADYP